MIIFSLSKSLGLCLIVDFCQGHGIDPLFALFKNVMKLVGNLVLHANTD